VVLRPGIVAGLLCVAATAAWAQGVIIPDLRNPALYQEPKGPSCRVCGEIRSIREVQTEAPKAMAPDPSRTTATSSNPNDWAVVGAAVILPTGSSASPHVGAVGTPEMVARFGASNYEITVRMDSGERQVVLRRDGARFRVGDRVTLSAGMMEPLR
jgi:outer membrane lipoprotein SlyB